MIFVVAPTPQPGRLLASQLRFFGAGDIPIYATVRNLRSRQHGSRQRLERLHLRGYAGAALARCGRERRARRPAGLLAAAHEPSCGSTAWASMRTA